MIFGRQPPPPKWTADFCGCGVDPKTCFITCLLPCITFGQIAGIIDEGKSSCARQGCAYGLLMCVQCHWLYSCLYREKLRVKYNLPLPKKPCCDCCVHFCCGACALCQEHVELKVRGLDPSKGWIGPPNAPPIMPQSMFRLAI